MMSEQLRPATIYVESGARENPLTEKVLSRLPDAQVVMVDDYKTIGLDKPFQIRAAEDKSSLALAEKKGEVLKSIGRMEDGEYYLFHEMDCSFDCEYCYLQHYFQTKVPVVFTNRERVLSEIEAILNTHPSPYFHAGEVSDALALDHLTDFSIDLIELFTKYEGGTIELRTKSANVQNLLSVREATENVIPSWTLSPHSVSELIEHKTPSPSERIEAAGMCQSAGYTVGIRLDPIFYTEDWEASYQGLVSQIFSKLDPKKIDYISLGTPKINKPLLNAIKQRFPTSLAVLGEMYPSGDGKYRYIKFLRAQIYKKIASWIKDYSEELEVRLSLETPEVESSVFEEQTYDDS